MTTENFVSDRFEDNNKHLFTGTDENHGPSTTVVTRDATEGLPRGGRGAAEGRPRGGRGAAEGLIHIWRNWALGCLISSVQLDNYA